MQQVEEDRTKVQKSPTIHKGDLDTETASRVDVEFARYFEMRDAVRKALGTKRRMFLTQQTG